MSEPLDITTAPASTVLRWQYLLEIFLHGFCVYLVKTYRPVLFCTITHGDLFRFLQGCMHYFCSSSWTLASCGSPRSLQFSIQLLKRLYAKQRMQQGSYRCKSHQGARALCQDVRDAESHLIETQADPLTQSTARLSRLGTPPIETRPWRLPGESVCF